MIQQYVAVAMGGALGAVLRYALSNALNGRAGWPFGTLVANASGALLIGLLAALMSQASALQALRPLLVVGFLGGLTTFSSFSLEALTLVQQQAFGRALCYLFGSTVLGLGLAWVGWELGLALAARRQLS